MCAKSEGVVKNLIRPSGKRKINGNFNWHLARTSNALPTGESSKVTKAKLKN